jgi:2-haloacid dehalogenase
MTQQSPQPSPAIVFDFGGVLLDWNPRYLYDKMFNENPADLDRFLTEVGFSEWNVQQDKGRPFADAVAELEAKFPHYAPYIRAYDERWEEFMGGPIHGTVELLYAIKQAGYPLYALSNWSAETFGRIRHQYDFLNWFDTIVLSGTLKLIKPDPQIFNVFLSMVSRNAEDCLFIDDSKANIAAASQLGFQTILFESPEQLKGELLVRGVLVGES